MFVNVFYVENLTIRWRVHQWDTFDDELRMPCTFFGPEHNSVGNDNFTRQSGSEIQNMYHM